MLGKEHHMTRRWWKRTWIPSFFHLSTTIKTCSSPIIDLSRDQFFSFFFLNYSLNLISSPNSQQSNSSPCWITPKTCWISFLEHWIFPLCSMLLVIGGNQGQLERGGIRLEQWKWKGINALFIKVLMIGGKNVLIAWGLLLD